jgi:hypothetical protein
MHSIVRGPDSELSIRPNDAVQCIAEYNRSSYRGMSNTALDQKAYRLFRDGISSDPGRLVAQIAFVGEEYGGAQERFGSIRKEAEIIASNLRPILDKWQKFVMEAKPLSHEVPNQETLDFIFLPFVGTKHWPVWASKTLHFIRPDVFPILDSNAKKTLGLQHLVNSSRNYQYSCSVFRQAFLENSESLAAARSADRGESPTDLKLLDKVLFQLGVRMN